MDALSLRTAHAREAPVAALIQTHFDLMRGSSPLESCHVMPADALGRAHMLAVEDSGVVIGVGALMEIAPAHGEIKSMHTAAAARGKGVARLILRGLLEHARTHGLTRVSLETGSAPLFAPARALYAREAFTICEPFGDYVDDPNSVFMTRAI